MHRHRFRLRQAFLACVLSCAASPATYAQTQGLVNLDPLRALQNLQGGVPGDNGVLQNQLQTQPQLFQPVIPEFARSAPPSRIEALYSERAGRPLTQFGYDILGVPTAVNAAQLGGIQDDYVLGVGDELIIDLRGQDNVTYRQRINRDGQIVIPRLAPIPLAGRSFAEARGDLERRITESYVSTNVFVSVGQIRQISVLVTGEVRAPGTRILGGLATPLDAILLSGGIAKTGSLRNVSLIRDNRSIPLDLYSLLTQGTLAYTGGLQSGDRIFVPPLSNTVAIAGFVKRPGIYELPNGQKGLGADVLIRLAGGTEIENAYRLSSTRVQTDGSIQLASLANRGIVASGEVLLVDPVSSVALDRVSLSGAARLTGIYPRNAASSVRNLIQGFADLAADAYVHFAVIVRRDPGFNTRTLVPVSLAAVFSGAADYPLQSDDQLYVFARNEIRILADTAAGRVPRTDNPVVSGISIIGRVTPMVTDPTLPPDTTPRVSGQPVPPSVADGVTPAGWKYCAQPAPTLYGPIPPPALSRENQPRESPATMALEEYRLGVPGVSSGTVPVFPNRQFQPQANQLQAGQNPPSGPDARVPPAIGSTFGSLPQYQNTPVPGLDCVQPPISPEAIALKLGVTTESVLRLAADHTIWVQDKVRDPGPYLAMDGVTLADIILLAGGPARDADLDAVEVSSKEVDPQGGVARTRRTTYQGGLAGFSRIGLRTLDVVRLPVVFSDRFEGAVSISGEVRNPGNFDIVRGERLSDVLRRAGGMTGIAFPVGAVFLRVSAAENERIGNERQARALSAQATSLLSSPLPEDRQKMAFLSTLTQEIRTAPALGRIATSADPDILKTRPELDIILEPGDKIVIPPRPSTVTVVGDVLSQGAFQYQPGMTADEYITLAGGTTRDADESRIFIILADGTARPLDKSWLSFSKTNVVPLGATIVVPRDLRPFNLPVFLRDATQIMSQLAISAASLSVVTRR